MYKDNSMVDWKGMGGGEGRRGLGGQADIWLLLFAEWGNVNVPQRLQFETSSLVRLTRDDQEFGKEPERPVLFDKDRLARSVKLDLEKDGIWVGHISGTYLENG
jgi:hypothetical protein